MLIISNQTKLTILSNRKLVVTCVPIDNIRVEPDSNTDTVKELAQSDYSSGAPKVTRAIEFKVVVRFVNQNPNSLSSENEDDQ